MTTKFHVLLAPDVGVQQAAFNEERVVRELRNIGLVGELATQQRDEHERIVSSYHPSPDRVRLFKATRPEPFLFGHEIRTIVGRYSNGWSINQITEYECPSCFTRLGMQARGDAFDRIAENMQRAVAAFIVEGAIASIACPRCSRERPANAWKCDVPPGFANLAIEFYDFPAFQSDCVSIPQWVFGHGEWLTDVPCLISKAASSSLTWSFGNI